MNKRVEAIIEEARKLTVDERMDLLKRLALEMDGDADVTPEEIEAAWLEDIKGRIGAFERGETKFRPAETVIADLRARLQRS